MIKKIIIILTLFFSKTIQASEIVGFPKVVDGDTIHIKSYKIRLEGIDAPEMKQKCKKLKKFQVQNQNRLLYSLRKL